MTYFSSLSQSISFFRFSLDSNLGYFLSSSYLQSETRVLLWLEKTSERETNGHMEGGASGTPHAVKRRFNNGICLENIHFFFSLFTSFLLTSAQRSHSLSFSSSFFLRTFSSSLLPESAAVGGGTKGVMGGGSGRFVTYSHMQTSSGAVEDKGRGGAQVRRNKECAQSSDERGECTKELPTLNTSPNSHLCWNLHPTSSPRDRPLPPTCPTSPPAHHGDPARGSTESSGEPALLRFGWSRRPH